MLLLRKKVKKEDALNRSFHREFSVKAKRFRVGRGVMPRLFSWYLVFYSSAASGSFAHIGLSIAPTKL